MENSASAAKRHYIYFNEVSAILHKAIWIDGKQRPEAAALIGRKDFDNQAQLSKKTIIEY